MAKKTGVDHNFSHSTLLSRDHWIDGWMDEWMDALVF
jgi:ribosome modulation factor